MLVMNEFALPEVQGTVPSRCNRPIRQSGTEVDVEPNGVSVSDFRAYMPTHS